MRETIRLSYRCAPGMTVFLLCWQLAMLALVNVEVWCLWAGAGIYTIPGFVSAAAGAGGTVFWLWVLADAQRGLDRARARLRADDTEEKEATT